MPGWGLLHSVDRMLAGRYRLIRPLGTGGMSVVWLGHDEVLDRAVAVKLLFAGFGRLRDEAKAAAGLSHPNVTTVFDYGEADGEPFVVMELVDGYSLAARLRDGALPWQAAVEVCAQVAAALSAAHARGLVHRDVTPSNIMLTASGVKVVDFGIATMIGAPGGGPVVGTAPYLAPERFSDDPGGPAADIFSLGVVLREALVGELQAPGPLPVIDGLPLEVAALYQRCVADDPAARPDAAWLARRLGHFSGVRVPAVGPHQSALGDRAVAVPSSLTRMMPIVDAPPKAGRTGVWVAAGVAVAIVVGVVAGLFLAHADPESTAVAAAPTSASASAAPSTPAPTGQPTQVAELPAPEGCTVQYHIQGTWDQGATIAIEVTNTGDTPLHGWTLRFTLADGLSVDGGWNGDWSQDGDQVTVVGVDNNADLDAGGTVSDLGTNLAGRHAGRVPREFTLNGATCQLDGQDD